ncbi:TPA: hypothetical protein ACN30T_004343 [Vibrio parahaemolyticus]
MPILQLIRKVIRKIKSKLLDSDVLELDYEYHLDACYNHVAKGWVYKKSAPSSVVHVAFKKGNITFCEVMANQARDDLKHAGLPNTQCAFDISPDLVANTLTPTLADLYFDGIKVNREPVVFAMDYHKLIEQLNQHSAELNNDDLNNKVQA